MYMREEPCETRSKINVPAVYLFLLQETTIYNFFGEVNAVGHFSKFGLVAISQN